MQGREPTKGHITRSMRALITLIPAGLFVLVTMQPIKQLKSGTFDALKTSTIEEKINSCGSSSSVFDSIVEEAYNSATQSPQGTIRKKFDVDYWENESNLTTTGGLGRMDRIMLGELYGEADSVFEYGLGESTYIANHVGVPRYAGIDSDPLWVADVRDKVASHFRFYYGDVGATGNWGYPSNSNLPKNKLNYQLAPLVLEQKPFDVYMVDGRWRVASALASFLHASSRGADPLKTKVLIHDCERKYYHNADHLLNLTRHSGGKLCLYQRFPHATDEALQNLWNEQSKDVKR